MKTSERLASLDILRGFDLFCLVFFAPVLVQFLRIIDIPGLQPVIRLFNHVPWEGFVPWDLIMPLFMFMSGITIPFAYAKYKKEVKVNSSFYRKITKRFCLLFFLGWIAQGNLLALDPDRFHIFANTLQAIAVGYIFATFLFVFCSLRTQVIFAISCLLIYMAVFVFAGNNDFTPVVNIAEEIDREVLGRWRDGVIWQDGVWSFDKGYNYTWILSSLNFIVTVMLGCFAGHILKNKEIQAMKKFYYLIGFGVALIVIALLISPFHPIIKKIWTSSMTLYSGGFCFILMGLFYYVIDIKKHQKGLNWLKFYGMNSITAYMLSMVLNFQSLSNSLFFGLKQYLVDFYPLIGTTFKGVIILLILREMYKRGIFLKV